MEYDAKHQDRETRPERLASLKSALVNPGVRLTSNSESRARLRDSQLAVPGQTRYLFVLD